jgi:hypothetical protein
MLPLSPSGSLTLDELPWTIAVARDIALPLSERADRFVAETIEAGLTPTSVEIDGVWHCTAYNRDGSIHTKMVLREGEPPREIKGDE